MKTWIVIAAYNEEHSIADVVKGLKRNGYQNVVVVDDGSPDKTSREAKKGTRYVVRHKKNKGQGAALRTGIRYALRKGADIIVTFDADGQHRVKDIPALVKPVAKGEVDVALGSRFLGKKSNIPLFRRIVLKGGAFVVWLFYGVWLTDSHNGFRALSRMAAQKIKITCLRQAHASEIVAEIKKNKLRYKEVPVVIKYTKYSMEHGQSSFNSIRIFWEMLRHKFRQ
jgi:glycosyltransferase involved in cell wall biosynthesis